MIHGQCSRRSVSTAGLAGHVCWDRRVVSSSGQTVATAEGALLLDTVLVVGVTLSFLAALAVVWERAAFLCIRTGMVGSG